MRKLRLFIAFGAILALSAPAYAQDGDDGFGSDDEFGSDTSSDTTSDTGMGADTGDSSATASNGGSTTMGGDFGQTDGVWGFQVSAVQPIPVGLFAGATLPLVGVRKWTGDAGIEAGATLALFRDGASEDMDVLVGVHAGMLKAFGIYDHMAVFWEPEVQFFFLAPGADGVDPAWAVNLLANVGTEVRLGVLGLPRIGVTAKLGGGITLGDDGSGFDFGLLVGTNQQTSVRGMLEGTVGFVFYR